MVGYGRFERNRVVKSVRLFLIDQAATWEILDLTRLLYILCPSLPENSVRKTNEEQKEKKNKI